MSDMLQILADHSSFSVHRSSFLPLAFGFITPTFALAGAGLVSIPIIIHLLNRRRFKTIPWAAMDFLLRAMRKNRRRIRFEQWLLLAMRCSVLFLLGLALARPLGCEDSSLAALAARRTGLHVIVIDNSYSMQFEADRPDAKTHLDQAKLLAKRLVDRFTSGGESVAIITASKPARGILGVPVFDPQAAKSAIDRIEPTFAGTDLLGALDLANKIAHDETRQPIKTLYLFSDSTRSAWTIPQQEQAMQSTGRELAKNFQQIVHYDLSRANQSNAAVIDVKPASNLLRMGFANDLVATVRGYGSVNDGLLQWKLDDQVLGGATTIHPQPDSPPITQSQFQLAHGGPHVVTASFAGDDRLKLDDTRTRVVDVASDLKVLIVEGERSADALGGSGALVMEALAPTAVDATPGSSKRVASYLSPELVSDLEFGNKVLADYRAIILAGVGQISANQADQLKHFVETGGTLVTFMGEPVNAENYNAMLLPRGLLPGPLAKRITATGGRDAFYLDFKPNASLHPLLHKFERASNTGLDRTPIFTYWQIDLATDSRAQRVLDYQNSGTGDRASGSENSSDTRNPKPDTRRSDPAIVLHDLGRGHVLTFSTSADLEWSALPGRLNFAPLLHELLSGTMSSGDAWMNLTVGDSLRIPSTLQFTTTPTLKDPQQAEVVLEQTASNGGEIYHSGAINKPGLYTLSTGSAKIPIAVNVPADEADIRTIDAAGIRKALGDIEIEFEHDQLPGGQSDVAKAGNDFGWSVMMIVLMLAAGECFLAMKFGHYKRQ